MLLKASSTLGLLAPSTSSEASSPRAAAISGGRRVSLPSYSGRRRRCLPRAGSLVSSAAGNQSHATVIFESLEDIERELSLVPASMDQSLARQRYADDCEDAINDQINVQYIASYVYHALFAYFDRDNVALRGMAKFFKESSEEERNRAEKLMKYQNQRGGRVKLHTLTMPLTEFDDPEKGDALYAMELTLSLKKLVNEKLLKLYTVAERSEDVQMQDFIESEFLTEQVEAIRKISEYVAQLRRVGKGHGVWHFDQMLLQGHAA